MSKSFSLAAPRLNLKDPRVLVRAALGVLLAANIAAALMAFKPWGGSAEDLARQQVDMQQQLTAMQARLEKTKALVAKAERARKDGDAFLAEYTVERQSTFSTIMAELEHEAQEAGIQSRPVNTELDPVEGSDSLYQLSINASYEGSYSNLTKLINLLDKSPRFLIIESLTAAPQQSQQANAGDLLSVNIKVDTFVRGKPGNPI